MPIRDVRESDLQALFEIQKDPESSWMAAFGSKDLDNKEAFLLHMSKIAKDKNVLYKVIEHEDRVVGNVGKSISEHGPELTYWTDKKFAWANWVFPNMRNSCHSRISEVRRYWKLVLYWNERERHQP